MIILKDTTDWEMRCGSKAVIEKETRSGQAHDLRQRAQAAPDADYLPHLDLTMAPEWRWMSRTHYPDIEQPGRQTR